MTNTYAINTTRGKEFEVEDSLLELGLRPWVPKRRDSRYIKEARSLKWYDRPYVPKLLFSVIPAIYWPDVVKIKHVIGKPYGLSAMDISGQPKKLVQRRGGGFLEVAPIPGLTKFREAVEAEYEDACRREANAEYECQYKPGEALKILDGPFNGFRAEFKSVIKRAHDDYAKLRVEVSVFGRESTVELDPDKVNYW